ncbi:restriction endonuclease subunit S [Methanosarcina mazei]|uniref:Type I restriction modification DNA specificity domain-containing protein n=1 Tax=Methanosarcina mazei TaxID=2209 RepID=A0A0F8ETE7_METMZ|nr:restriction endonuclease subunit S [Methanosarcina mazei]KKG33434.1 hypothetical protein DU52_07100 [Methanosarcina mazei]KKG35316.1 hypothetical protein DU30_04150 [Methanosarcina mazei]KKG62749.1 hypothetical protein DU67_00450 [Methanosarcina mazei]
MTGEWKECKLGDVAEIVGGGTPNTNESKYWNGEIAWLTPRDLSYFNGRYISKGERNISKLGLAKSSAKILPKGSVLLSSRAPVGYLAIALNEITTNQGFRSLIPNSNTDNLFLYYLLKNNVEYLKSQSTGTTFIELSGSTLKSLSFLFPSLPEQRAIASVLSSLDDKIDLLHRQNKTLEAMAETLFRQWFVEEADEEWEERNVTELFEIRDGTHDSPKQKEIGKALLTSKHILKDRLDIENAYLISNEDFGNINRRSKVDTNDILFSMIGTIGLIYLEQSSEINYAIKNIGLFKTSQNPEWAYYTFLWLKSSLGQDFIHEHRSGSTQEYISLGSLRSIVFRCPPTKLHREFNEIINLYFNKIKFNNKQIRTLEKLRDTLLPKLMSGEVRVEFAQGDQPDE